MISEFLDVKSRAWIRFRQYNINSGFSLDYQSVQAFQSLFAEIEARLRRDVEPTYKIFPIGTGGGKTTGVGFFVKVWEELGFRHGGGAIICFSRIREIHEFAKRSGLLPESFAVLSNDNDTNHLGLGHTQVDKAPILLTTQQMVRFRAVGRSFAECKEFHFQGAPRALQVWDESFLPAEPMTISVAALSSMDRFLRSPRTLAFCNAMLEFVASIMRTEPGQTVRVPNALPGLTAKEGEGWNDHQRALLDEHKGNVGKLILMRGQPMMLLKDNLKGMTLVGATPPLPADFTPIVLDASARIRGDYPLWKAHSASVSIAPPVASDYRDLTFNLWKHGCGKTVLADDAKRAHILGHVADVINRDATTRWLVLHYKTGLAFDIPKELRRLIDDESRVSFCHWGDHHGLNDHREIENVIVMGAFGQPHSAYLARYLAATGKAPGDLDGSEWKQIMSGEFRHNMLQGISRSNVRNVDRGIAGRCNVHIVAPASSDPETLLAETFPGCSIQAWRPVPPRLGERAQRVADYLQSIFADLHIREVKKKAVSTACGFKNRKDLSQVLKQGPMQSFLIEQSIEWVGQVFTRAGTYSFV
jgi:hypothetical protein